MIGRRIPVDPAVGWWNALSSENARPGDYYGPVQGKDTSCVFFLLPGRDDPDAPASAREIHHVASPPHKFRECPDGSLEIRNSLSDQPGNTGWHGWLDEGHSWRLA